MTEHRIAKTLACALALFIGTVRAAVAAPAGGPQPQVDVVAIYADEPVLVTEVVYELKAQGLEDTKPNRERALNDILLRRMMTRRVRLAGLNGTPEVVADVRRSVDGALVRAYEQRLMATTPEPAEPQVQAFLKDNPGRFAERRVYVVRRLTVRRANPDPARFAPIHDLKTLRALLDAEGEAYEETVSTVDSATSDAGFTEQLANLQGKDIFAAPEGKALVFGEVLSVHEMPLNGETAKVLARTLLRLQQLRSRREQELRALFDHEAPSVTYPGAVGPPQSSR